METNTASQKRKPDKRVCRTKHAICTALVALLGEKDINEITIKDIAERAEINRKTFYNYYTGIYQVIDEIKTHLANVFGTMIAEADIKNPDSYPYEILSKLNSLILTDPEFYSNIIKIDMNVSVSKDLVNVIKAKIKSAFHDQLLIKDKALDYLIEFNLSGILSLYQDWFLNGQQMPLEELADIASMICSSGSTGIGKYLEEKYNL